MTSPEESGKSSKKGKKAQLVIRLDEKLRQDFVETCQDLDTSASREIRQFMKRFLKRHKNRDKDD